MPATPVSWLPETIVNADPAAAQQQPVITQLASGHILVAWTDYNDGGVGTALGTDIIGQIYDPLGNKVGGEFQLNVQNTSDDETGASLAALPGGGFIVTYSDYGADSNVSYDIWTVNPFSGVATHDSGGLIFDGAPGGDIVTGSAVAVTSSTDAAVAYAVEQASGDAAVYTVAFNPATGVLGTADDLSLFNEASTAITGLHLTANGLGEYRLGFVDPDVGGPNYLTVWNIDADGHWYGGTAFAPSEMDPESGLAVLSGGERASVYAAGGDIFIRMWGTDSAIPVAPSEAGNLQNEPTIVPLLDGGFVVIWDDDTLNELRAQRYDAAGTAVGTIFNVTTGTASNFPQQPGATLLGDGRFAVTWHDGTNVLMEIFDPRDGANTEGVYAPDQWQIGTPGGDDIIGDAISDQLSDIVHGWDGGDGIISAGQPRSYFGDNGNDTIVATSVINGDWFDGGNGYDLIDWQGSGVGGATFNLTSGTASNGITSEGMANFENLNGTPHADVIYGNASINELNGVGGDDVIHGRNGADMLDGGAGDDFLRGGNSPDTIFGGAGDDTIGYLNGDEADTIDGGDDADTIDFSAVTTSSVTINLQAGTYTISGFGSGTVANVEHVVGSQQNDMFEGDIQPNSIQGVGGDDTLDIGFGSYHDGDAFDGGSGSDTIRSSLYVNALEVDLAAGTFRFAGFTRTLMLTSVENAIGNSGADTLLGSDFANFLAGNDGDDSLDGVLGDDVLKGGGGNDTLVGGPGADALFGGLGTDTASYAASGGGVTVDLLFGTGVGGHADGDTFDSVENIIGSAADDNLLGAVGGNTFDGGAGNDTIEGSLGGDTLTGGSGFGDTLSYATSALSVFVNLATGTASGGDAEGDVFSGFEDITGGVSNDGLTGDTGANILTGGGGNDTLTGGLGADTLDGGNGLDVAIYLGAIGPVWINLATGATSGGYAAGDVFVSIEALTGSNFADQLTGDAGNNRIDGWIGGDILNGSNGDDILLGFDGDDNLTGGAGADLVNGESGIDTANYSNSDAAVQIDMGAATATGGHALGDTLSGIEELFGSFFADTLTGNASANRLDGFNGDDLLDGGAGGDRINGGNGTDTLTYASAGAGITIFLGSGGGLGDIAEGDYVTSIEAVIGSAFGDRMVGNQVGNLLEGGGGIDDINGSNGNDTILGGDGEDLIVGGAGGDFINGGNSWDTVYYYNSNAAVTVNLSGGPGSGGHAQGDTFQAMEHVTGSAFADTLTGNNGDNVLDGWIGNDMLNGVGGTDFLNGERGDDYLIGGTGEDHLDGGTGFDTLSGGGGADAFFYTIANFGQDTVTTFEDGLDHFNMIGSGLTFADFTETQVGANTVLTTAAGYSITILNTDASLIEPGDFIV